MLEPRTDGETIWLGSRFSFTLQRTLRIPDDEGDYPLPPGLGSFVSVKLTPPLGLEFIDGVPVEVHWE